MEVTAVTQADTNRQGAGEGHRVMKRTIVPNVDAQKTLYPSRELLGSEKHYCPNASLRTSAVPTQYVFGDNRQTDLTVGNQCEGNTYRTLSQTELWTQQKS